MSPGKMRVFRVLKGEEKGPLISSRVRQVEIGSKKVRVRGSGKRGRPPGRAVEGLKFFRVVRDALGEDEGGFSRGAVLSVEEVRLMMKYRTITPGTVIEDQNRKRFLVKDTFEGLRKEEIEYE